MKKFKKLTAFICAAALLLSLAACSKKNENISSKQSSLSSDIMSSDIVSDLESDAQESISSEDTLNSAGSNSGNTKSSLITASAVSGGSSSVSSSIPKPTGGKTVNIKDFGAKGDGITDDGVAILNAVGNLKAGDTLVFESNKTYYAKNNGAGMNYIINIANANGITLKGNNTTLLIDAPKAYIEVNNSANVTIEGFNFDYKTKPAFRATAVSSDINTTTGVAVMTADRDIGLENNEVYQAPRDWFGVLEMNESRHHTYIKSYKMLDKSKRKVEVTFNVSISTTKNFLEMLKNGSSPAFVAPMPFVGHLVERAFSFSGNTDFTMKNCNVYAISRFGFAIFNSEGTVLFNNVNIGRAPNQIDQKLFFAGWRDGFHCKQNRGKIVWENCKVADLYDDVINLSSSILYVKEVNANKTEIDMFWEETNGGAFDTLKSGDKLTIINTTTGQIIGSASIQRVMKQSGSTNRVLLDKALPNLASGSNILVMLDSLSAPGSEIKNCNFNGTFRFRGKLTVTNTKIHNRRMWMDIDIADNKYVEGPVPQNITFKNCAFTLDSGGEVFHISAHNSKTGSNTYHVKNIVFDGCTGISKSRMEIGSGDEVIIK